MAETAAHAGRLERENEELHQENARLRAALEELQLKLDEPEEVIRAIRRGEVDAVVVQEDGEEELYALHRFDAAYRMMVEECFPYGVWLAEPDGNLRYVSPSFLELLEADLTELRAKGQFHFLPPGVREEVEREWDRCRKTGRPFNREYTIRLKDGQERIIWTQGLLADTPDGRRHWVGVNIDITDRIQAGEELRKKNERLTLLSEAAAALLHVDDPDRMLHTLVEKIGPHFGLDGYFHYLVNETGDALQLESCLGIPEETARSIRRLEFGQAICGAAALQKQPIVATHVQQSDDPRAELVKSLGIRAYVCHPLLAGDRLLGTLSFASRTRDELDNEELEFLRTISHYLTISYERVRLIRQLQDADRRKDEFLATLAHELRIRWRRFARAWR
jgi:PAS domain S-box-containing protein